MLVTHQIRDAFYVAEHQAPRHQDSVQVIFVARRADTTFMVLHQGIYLRGGAASDVASEDEFCASFRDTSLLVNGSPLH
jgi:hypothetical protein